MQDDTLDHLLTDLQTALQLEWSTLPPYLYACWSLENPHGPEALSIRRVIGEEMLHLGMVCNLVNALGGEPCFGGSEVPKYPGPAPGLHNLHLRLLPWSEAALQLFVHIEAPSSATDERRVHSKLGGDTPTSIAAFYEAIQKELNSLANERLSPRRQLVQSKPQAGGTLLAITAFTHEERRQQALDIIAEIVMQGDGTRLSGDLPPLDEPTHWTRFRRLLKEFNEHPPATLPVVADPIHALDRYSPEQLRLNAVFNSAYSELVDGLGAAFRMSAPNLYAAAGPAMLAMEKAAADLRRSGPLGRTDLPGPTFEYRAPFERLAYR
jgi:Ferritin-like